MSALNDYVNAVDRNLIGIERRKRYEILRDLRMQILSLSEDYGGGEEGIKKAMEELGPPEELAKMYVDRYGALWKDVLLKRLNIVLRSGRKILQSSQMFMIGQEDRLGKCPLWKLRVQQQYSEEQMG